MALTLQHFGMRIRDFAGYFLTTRANISHLRRVSEQKKKMELCVGVPLELDHEI